MSAKELIAEANELFVDENYEEALDTYNKAIKADPTKSSVYLHRSSTHAKLDDNISAVQDCGIYLKMEPKSHNGWYKKGMAYFYLDEFDSALSSFNNAKLFGNTNCKLWIQKCEAELRREDRMSQESQPTTPENEPRATPSKSIPGIH